VPPTPGQLTKEPMVIPLALGLVGKDGRDLPLTPASGGQIERGLGLDLSLDMLHLARDRLEPEADIHASAAYRSHLVAVLTARALREAASRAPTPEGVPAL